MPPRRGHDVSSLRPRLSRPSEIGRTRVVCSGREVRGARDGYDVWVKAERKREREREKEREGGEREREREDVHISHAAAASRSRHRDAPSLRAGWGDGAVSASEIRSAARMSRVRLDSAPGNQQVDQGGLGCGARVGRCRVSARVEQHDGVPETEQGRRATRTCLITYVCSETVQQ